MPIRQFLTTGVAFATVGMVAAIPAIAPPLQPQDVQVVNATEAQVRLAAAVTPSVTDLINVYFGVSPEGGLPAVWTPGTSGPTGVIYQLLRAQTDDGTDAATAVDGLFTLGMAKVIGDYLYYHTEDPALQRAIFAWFGGGLSGEGALSNLVRQLLIDNGPPLLAPLVDQYWAGGATRLGFLGLSALTLLVDPTHESTAVLGAIFNGTDLDSDGVPDVNKGITAVTHRLLKQASTDPVSDQFLDDYFSGGMMAVAKTQLDAALPDSALKDAVDAYFDGGAFGLAHEQLRSLITEPTAQGLLDEYFDNGISGMARFMLAGPAPVAPEETLMLAKSSAVPEERASEEPEALASEPEAAKPEAPKVEALSAAVVDTKPVDTLPAAPVAVIAPAPAAVPAPVAETPVPAEDPKPVDTVDATDVMKNGGDFSKNADDELILLPGGTRPKDRPHSWGVFGKVAKAIGNGLAGGKAGPAGGATPGGAEGASEGGGGAEG